MLETMTLDVLCLARAVVASGWTRKMPACDRTGHLREPLSRSAESWCISGALLLARVTLSRDLPSELTWPLCVAVGEAMRAPLEEARSLPEWNDAPERTQAEVLALFDTAAGLLGKG